MRRTALTLVALGCTATALVLAALASLEQTRGVTEQFILLGAVIVLGLPIVGASMKSSLRTLSRHPLLLFPLGVSLLVLEGLDALFGALAADFGDLGAVDLGAMVFHLSVPFLAMMFVAVAYATWATSLVVRVVRHDDDDPLRALAGFGRRFLVVLVLLALGWTVLLAPMLLVLPLSIATWIGLVFLFVPLWTGWWCLRTAPLLLVAVQERLSVGAGIRRGLAAGRSGMGRWAMPVVLHLLLLGVIVHMQASSTTEDLFASRYTHTRHSNWFVHGIWNGGYEAGSKWHGDLVALMDEPAVPLVATVLALALGIVALLVKIHVAQALAAKEGASDNEAS